MLACNVGKTDKIIRILVGVGILAAGFFSHSWFGLIGILPILTAVFGRCGLYYPFKINTIKKEARL
jgi:hypothetical protein